MAGAHLPTHAIVARVLAGAEAGLLAAAEKLKDDAQNAAPKSGSDDPSPRDLRTSGEVRKTGPLRYEVGFNVPWAEVQHERLDYEHPQGGGPKYLEAPSKALVATLPILVSEGVKKALP